MKTSDFNYHLLEELIAQEPVVPRDSSRLLLLDRKTGDIRHHIFREIKNVLKKGDLLVMNNTKVYPARLYTHKTTGAAIEMLFLERFSCRRWRIIAKGGRKLRAGTRLIVDSDSSCLFSVEKRVDNGSFIVNLEKPENMTIDQVLQKHGRVPLPPYIKREDESSDRETYQTVYAKERGAVAAPTAGLHFTQELLSELDKNGIERAFVTLHVGLGTFLPVKEDDPRDHLMHRETFSIDQECVSSIERAKNRGGRIIAAGTTTVRVLEHCAAENGKISPCSGDTGIFILPGYKFKAVDGLITNFHLPCSTLLMLVSAFAGRERVLRAYEEAVKKKYRFYSYGDAMLLL